MATKLLEPLTSQAVSTTTVEGTDISKNDIFLTLKNRYNAFLSKAGFQEAIVGNNFSNVRVLTNTTLVGNTYAIKTLIENLFKVLGTNRIETLKFPGKDNKEYIISVVVDDYSYSIPVPTAENSIENENDLNWINKFIYEFETDYPNVYNVIERNEAASEINQNDNKGNNFKELSRRIQALEDRHSLEKELAWAKAQLTKTVDEQKAALGDAISAEIDRQKNAFQGELSEAEKRVSYDLQSQAETMLENKKNELVETIINEDAMQLWETKAKQHTKYFRIGAMVFIVAVLMPLFALLFNWTSITTSVKNLTPAGQTIALGNLAVITIPVLFYAWVLRLISRFTLQNMTLADDAHQRSVMARTFIRLVGQGQVEEHDRTLMLNALFRPLPGAAEPDIQPPNLTDFVKAKP